MSQPPAQQHFDTFETVFFQAGEDGASLPGALDLPDDWDSSPRRHRPLLSRPSLLGLTAASTLLALLACMALWRSNSPLPALPATVTPPTKTAAMATAEKPPTPDPPPTESAAAGATAATERPPSPASAPAAAPPAVAPAAAPTTGPALANAEPAPVVAEENTKVAGAANAEAAAQAADPPVSDARERCQQSIRTRRNKAILAFCPAAFAEDAGAPDVAVAIAKVELDRGHYTQAYVWSKKAIAINPDFAEAYVFAGGAEQSKGHGKVAKEAYLHYLRLAPSGRYAAELRAIVSSL